MQNNCHLKWKRLVGDFCWQKKESIEVSKWVLGLDFYIFSRWALNYLFFSFFPLLIEHLNMPLAFSQESLLLEESA